MTREELQQLVLEKLFTIAPDLAGEDIEPDTSIRDQYDFDSMDYLNFIIALHKALKVDIPERDYPKLNSINACVDYLVDKLD